MKCCGFEESKKQKRATRFLHEFIALCAVRLYARDSWYNWRQVKQTVAVGVLAQLLLDAGVEIIVVLHTERNAVVLLVGARSLRVGITMGWTTPG